MPLPLADDGFSRFWKILSINGRISTIRDNTAFLLFGVIFSSGGNQYMELRKIGLMHLCFVTTLCAIYACLSPGLSWGQAPYYQGKTLTILRGGSPGGYGDLQARALIPYLKKYIPVNRLS
jgi:hypothetical protein